MNPSLGLTLQRIGEPKRWTRNTFSENYANISELWKP
jgi:hypothetical protein